MISYSDTIFSPKPVTLLEVGRLKMVRSSARRAIRIYTIRLPLRRRLRSQHQHHNPIRSQHLNRNHRLSPPSNKLGARRLQMKDAQKHQHPTPNPELVEVWFKIEKDADGYPETKSWEGMLAHPEGSQFRLISVPFYLKNVSRGDLVAASNGEFLEFSEVVSRGGHNTYRLLIKKLQTGDPSSTISELVKRGLAVEEEHGLFLAVDVPPSVDQIAVDAYLVEETKAGRWEMQDGFLSNITIQS